jgi:hypothetical protein
MKGEGRNHMMRKTVAMPNSEKYGMATFVTCQLIYSA